jgi:hypothetical protein
MPLGFFHSHVIHLCHADRQIYIWPVCHGDGDRDHIQANLSLSPVSLSEYSAGFNRQDISLTYACCCGEESSKSSLVTTDDDANCFGLKLARALAVILI